MFFVVVVVVSTENGYPLLIKATKVEIEETPVDYEFVEKLMSKVDFPVLISTAQQLATDHQEVANFLGEVLEQMPSDESSMVQMHKILFDVHIVEGHLICPGTGRKFPIRDGIPNMILHEDEI